MGYSKLNFVREVSKFLVGGWLFFAFTLTFLGPAVKVHFCRLTKTGIFCDFFIINIIIRECSSTLYVGLQHAVPPTNTNTKFKLLLLLTQACISYTNSYKHRTSYFKSTLTFLGLTKWWKSISADQQNQEILAISSSSIQSENTVALSVVLQHAKFKPLLFPTQSGIHYTNSYKHRTSYFKSTLTFLGPAKRWKSICAD